MERTYTQYDIPKEWMVNLERGLCWCGAPKPQFEQYEHIFCSEEHARLFASKIKNWSEFRNSFLSRHGMVCDGCGTTPEKAKERQESERHASIESIIKEFPTLIANVRARKLLELDEKYKLVMDDAWIVEHGLWADARELITERLHPLREIQFEVDHKVAIANGGEEFNEDNLQVLCADCHRKKTRQDCKDGNWNKRRRFSSSKL